MVYWPSQIMKDPDRKAVAEILRAATGWLAATRVRKIAPSFGAKKRTVLHQAAKVLNAGVEQAVVRAGVARDSTGPNGELLTPRDREIVALLASGSSYKEIAQKLGIGYGTVHTKIKHLYKRFGVNTKLALVELFRAGIR
ncbi:MAG: helix-turn-helix transcriptional regulator [Deltaproteobacteria bacterium]|nr:helix-turn-helix transcriptional regulator [Deltaproteobacteria bacterium]